MNKEIEDALCMLLNLSLKDKEYTTQKQQFNLIYNYIKKQQEKLDKINELLDKYFKDEYFTSNIAKDIQKITNEKE